MTTTAIPPRLDIEALACERGGRRLLSEFSLSAGTGALLQLTGANGRGKTSLLRTLCGLQRPAAGRVLWRGQDIHLGAGYGGELLYLAHENALNPDLTPRENLAALTALHGQRGNITEALTLFSVAGVAGKPCRRLSAGQRRRVALARLALSTAPLWLLDEPAAALDADGRTALAALLSGHARAGGIVLFTTHEPLARVDAGSVAL